MCRVTMRIRIAGMIMQEKMTALNPAITLKPSATNPMIMGKIIAPMV